MPFLYLSIEILYSAGKPVIMCNVSSGTSSPTTRLFPLLVAPSEDRVRLVTSVMSNSLRRHGPWPARLLCPWDSPGENTAVGCHDQKVLILVQSEVAQSCLTLCDPMDYNLPGSSIHRVFQARVLEWVAISFSSGSSQPRNRTRVSCIAGRRFTI